MNKPSMFITRGQALKMLPFTATARWLEQREACGDFPASTRASDGKLLYVRADVEKWVADFLAEVAAKKEAARLDRKTTVETAKDSSKPARERPQKKTRRA